MLPRELRNVTEYGNRLTVAVQNVLLQRFQHRNRDGTWFQPHVIQAVTALPYLHYVVIDPSALWHYSKAELLSRETLDAISGAVGLPVQGSDWIHNDPNADIKSGIVYGILLKPLPRLEAPSVPSVAPLSLDGNNSAGNFRVPIGRTVKGEWWERLDKIGHALIAGTTGSGKSTWLNTAIAALLMAHSPDQLRIALVDPKASVFGKWKDVPHLWGQVANDSDQWKVLLASIVAEMNRRGKIFSEAKCEDFDEYARKAPHVMPYLLVIVDEGADLASWGRGNRDSIGLLQIIAQRGRSAGVFLWIGLQRVTEKDGLPGQVRANLMARFIFRVENQHEAELAECDQAHTIPAISGRMYARLQRRIDPPTLVQGFFMGNDEIRAIAFRLSGQSAEEGTGLGETERTLIAWAVAHGEYLSIVDIQREAGLGHQPARKLAASMEARGLIFKDSKNFNKRKVTTTAKRFLEDCQTSDRMMTVGDGLADGKA